MNSDEHQHELTAYALGELTRDEEAAMRSQIAASPQMQAELAGIESVTDALQHGAPVPVEKLHPHQRQAVLNPAKAPRFITPMMPQKKAPAPRVFRFAPFFAGVTKIAAVIALTGAAFYLGHRSRLPAEPQLAAVQPKPAAPAVTEQLATTKPAAPQSAAQAVAAVEKKSDAKPLASAPPPAPAAPETKAEAKPLPAPAASQPVVAAAPLSPPSALSSPPPASTDEGFIATNRTAVAKVSLRPHDTRPLPPKTAKGEGPVLASPSQPAAAELKNDRAAKRPDFIIDSWKAEVATCPWNPAHKLLRVLVQSPANQAAASSTDFEFPLNISFDPLAVRSYRLISKSSHAPAEGGKTALQVLWYQIMPNGSDPARENGRIIAAITLPNSRFESPAIGPFDNSTKLQAIDRGMKWDNARDDFLLETAIVGFGLLLRGEHSIGELDHELVLRIARQAKGADASGERARFIKLVQEAKRITGI